MKLSPDKRGELSSAALVQSLCLVLVGCSAFGLTALAADPGWWSSPGTGTQPAVQAPQVVTVNGVVTTNNAPNPYAVVNQGQLKQFTVRAVDELNVDLPGGAGSVLNTMASNWAQEYVAGGYNASNVKPSDYDLMNAGQLKYIGNQIWPQLVNAGYTNAVPSWLQENTNSDNDLAVLGQLKQVFNFDLSNSLALKAPDPVTNLVATYPNANEIDLSWTLPSGNNAQSIIVQESTDGGQTWTTAATLANSSTAYAATGLVAGQSYNFQIISSNAGGASNPVYASNAGQNVSATFGTPAQCSEAMDASGNMNLSWQPVANATSYTIDRETVSTGSWNYGYASVNTGSYQDTVANRNSNNEGYVYQVTAISSTATSTPSSPFPASRYAFIDLGTNVAPIKVTDSAYVLAACSTTNTGRPYTCFYAGQTCTLTPYNSGGEIRASDINESGTIVGQETSTWDPDNRTIKTGIQEWSFSGMTFQPNGAPSYANAYSGSMLVVEGGNWWEDWSSWESFVDAWNIVSENSAWSPPPNWTLDRCNLIDSHGNIYSTCCPRYVTNSSQWDYQPIFDDFKNNMELGTVAPDLHGVVYGKEDQVEMADDLGETVIKIINFPDGPTQSSGTATVVFDDGSGHQTSLKFTPWGMNNDGIVVGQNSGGAIWWDKQHGIHVMGSAAGPGGINAAKTTASLAPGQVGPPATVYAYQGIAGPLLWEMAPTTDLLTSA